MAIVHSLNAAMLARPHSQLSSKRCARATGINRSKEHLEVSCASSKPETSSKDAKEFAVSGRREMTMNSVAGFLFFGSIFNFTGEQPKNLGLKSYGKFESLGLCPPSPNCISTAEEANDLAHYVPQWTYNPGEGRGSPASKKPKATQEQAMAELKAAVESCEADGFTPTVEKVTGDYLYATFQSPIFGFVDDVEFYFPPGDGSTVEYRSASRLGESDGDVNRKRIKALRQALEKKGWASVGF